MVKERIPGMHGINNYVGEWKDDQAHGQGTLTMADRSKQVGEFKNGEFIG